MNKEVSFLEKQIDEIIRQLKKFKKHRLFNDDVYHLFEEKRVLQRELSLAKNQETAILLDYLYPWDTGCAAASCAFGI